MEKPLLVEERCVPLCQEIQWIDSARALFHSDDGLVPLLSRERIHNRFAIDTLREWGALDAFVHTSPTVCLDAYAALLLECRDGGLRWIEGTMKIAQTRDHCVYLKRSQCTCLAPARGDALCPLECEILYLHPESANKVPMSIETLERADRGGCAYKVHWTKPK
ncbi:MAG: hypothetical protein ACYCPS_06085 [Candidatus Saccharimonadales bacterium]